MKAIIINRFGGADRLELAEISTPKAEADEVLIRVVDAGVNPVDWKIREGMLAGLFPHRFPLILGWDVAGTVADRNGGHRLPSRRQSLRHSRKPVVQWGTYAEYVTVPASAVAPMPANLTFAQAAAIPLTALTSWQALFDAGRLEAGQSVLIHAMPVPAAPVAWPFSWHGIPARPCSRRRAPATTSTFARSVPTT